MSTFIKSDQSALNLLRALPISRSGFVHPDQRVITGLTCNTKNEMQKKWKQEKIQDYTQIVSSHYRLAEARYFVPLLFFQNAGKKNKQLLTGI